MRFLISYSKELVLVRLKLLLVQSYSVQGLKGSPVRMIGEVYFILLEHRRSCPGDYLRMSHEKQATMCRNLQEVIQVLMYNLH